MDKRYIISSFFNNVKFDVNNILDIIVKYNVEYSTNSNGIFVNLTLLEDDIIDKIYYKLINTTNKNVKQIKSKELKSNVKIKKKVKYVKEHIKKTQYDMTLIDLSKKTLSI